MFCANALKTLLYNFDFTGKTFVHNFERTLALVLRTFPVWMCYYRLIVLPA